jgi:hypothetical protein
MGEFHSQKGRNEMASVSSSVTINQPVGKVFAYVTGVENHKVWQAGILDAKVTPAGPVGVGSIYHYTSQVMGRKMETQLQVSAFELSSKIGSGASRRLASRHPWKRFTLLRRLGAVRN